MNPSVFVDRITGDIAVLQAETGEEFMVPTSWLPPGGDEGTWVTVTLAPDQERTAAERQGIEELRTRLSEQDDGEDLAL